MLLLLQRRKDEPVGESRFAHVTSAGHAATVLERDKCGPWYSEAHLESRTEYGAEQIFYLEKVDARVGLSEAAGATR